MMYKGVRIASMLKNIIVDTNRDNAIIQKVEHKGILRYKSLKR